MDGFHFFSVSIFADRPENIFEIVELLAGTDERDDFDLLHQSVITGGSLRSLREVFEQGDTVKALITELDPGRGRIALNTALLEGQPGELLVDKDTVMAEATDRANRARNVLRQQEQSAG